jgi:hypothetical protein
MEAFPTTAEDQTLHPYYDNVDGDVWLTAFVNQTTPASFTFGVTPPAAWVGLTVERVERHMDSFGLHRLFVVNAANELVGIRKTLSRLYAAGGLGSVRDELLDREQSWRASGRINTWQAAMYQAAGASDWFSNGGFAQV